MKMRGEEYGAVGVEARNYVWMGAIPLHLELHKDEIVTLPAPPPFMLLAPRNSYLPLLVDSFRPHFQSALPPGSDTVWFDYNGLPLKWHIPTGVLFDLLCIEPQRPWRLTVHFRTYPSDILNPCDGEEPVKWNFINSLKESSYIMYGNTKTVMSLSQSDQLELWRSVVKADGESYDRISVRLRPGLTPSYAASVRGLPRAASDGHPAKPGWASLSHPARIPLRFYIRVLHDEVEDLFEVPPVATWDEVAYATRPMEVPKDEGKTLTIRDALMKAVPHLFSTPASSAHSDSEDAHTSNDSSKHEESKARSSDGEQVPAPSEATEHTIAEVPALPPNDSGEDAPQITIPSSPALDDADVFSKIQDLDLSASSQKNRKQDADSASRKFNGIIRIQGIEPDLDLPLDWLARNMCNPEQFVHVIIFTWVSNFGSGD